MSFLSSKLIFAGAVLLPPLICYVISKIEGRNTTRWLLYGVFFGIFAIIYLVFYTKKGDQDRISPGVMVLLGIFMALMLISVYETFFGLILK